MCAQFKDLKFFQGGSLDTDSAIEYLQKNDYLAAYNLRVSGTNLGEGGLLANIESNIPLSQSQPNGINRCIGSRGFELNRIGIAFIYNSAGFHQIRQINYDTDSVTVLFTNLTDSGGENILPLNPQNYVDCILVDNLYLIWAAVDLEVGYVNLTTLASGGYPAPVSYDQITLLKPQCLIPPIGTYGNDAGQPANYLFGKLPQFNVQWVNPDFNYTTWSTWSERIVPYQQNTPTLGSDVTKSNYIIVSVDIGNISVSTVNIGCRFGTEIYSIIKSVDRAYILALTHIAVDIATQVFEAYNPTTNLYSFAFYNNDIAIPVTPTETDLLCDVIYPSNTVEVINGDIVSLADWKTLYPRPITQVSVSAVGYDPNIAIPVDTNPTPLRVTYQNTGSFKGRPRVQINYAGLPRTDDILLVTLVNTTNASDVQQFSYTVPSAYDGQLDNVIYSFSTQFDAANWFDNGDGTASLFFTAPHNFKLQTASVQLHFIGAPVSNSIPDVLDNSPYQAALAYYDKFGRPFPIETDNTFKATTPSYAQVNGNAVQITVAINTPIAPPNAATYQVLLTKPPVDALLDIMATPLNYIDNWNAFTNTPTLSTNDGARSVGDTYQINTPSSPGNTGHYTNLGTNATYLTGDYLVYNGLSYDILPKSFGDLTTTGNILAFSLNSLNLFNSEYAEEGVETVLGYDFSVGDRCTLHYYIDGSGNKVFINNPCVNLSVFGYDSGNYIVKVEKPATFDATILAGENVFIRLYTPSPQVQAVSATQNGTVFYEIGQRFTITDGVHDTTNIVLTDGGVYYKTRQYSDALKPYANPPLETLSVDLNYSDFYPSAFSSFGRPRTYYDTLEPSERKANIITSQSYILGSRKNGLNRFYPENIYGDADGQTSSSHGAIQVMWQRGDVLVVIQESNVFYIPVNLAYQVLNDQLTGVAISEKLLNNGRYSTEGIGIGLHKESFCFNKSNGYFISPQRSEPYQITVSGVNSISDKMTKYFRKAFQTAFALGLKVIGWYDIYYDEYIVSIQQEGGSVINLPFSASLWRYLATYSVLPATISIISGPSHSSASYNNISGDVVLTPASGYVGNDTLQFSFPVGMDTVTKNACFAWTAGTDEVFSFAFNPLVGVPLSTLETSNTIGVFGNTIPSPISITGGQYSVNGGAWTSSAGFVNAGDSVQVRQTSSSLGLTQTDCVLTIDGQSGTFSVTTVVGTFDLTLNVTESADPYSDANLQIKLAGTILTTINGTDTQHYTPNAGQLLSAEGFSENPSTGSSPTKTLDVILNGVHPAGYPMTNSNNPGDASLFWNTYTPVSGDVIVVNESATATALPSDATGILVVDVYNDTDLDIIGYVNTVGTIPYQDPVYTGKNFVPVSTPANNCWALASDLDTDPTLKWRFEFNVAQLISVYPSATAFQFIISGRIVGSSSFINGRYDLQSAASGMMIMTGSPGTYLPSTSGTTNIGSVAITGAPIVGGGDGTHGIGIGAVILTFDYDVTTKVMTLTP